MAHAIGMDGSEVRGIIYVRLTATGWHVEAGCTLQAPCLKHLCRQPLLLLGRPYGVQVQDVLHLPHSVFQLPLVKSWLLRGQLSFLHKACFMATCACLVKLRTVESLGHSVVIMHAFAECRFGL